MSSIANGALVTNPILIFFVVLVIILLAPLILKKINIPHVVGIIIAGVIVGPFGLHILEKDSSFEIFGQVGLLYLMFLAGLEIDMFHLRRNMRKGLVFGVLTLFIPIIIGMLTSVYVLHVSWGTSVLLACMYSAHTLISYPVVSRFGVSKTPVVLIAIVGTIVAILGSLLVLAVTVDIYKVGAFSIGAISSLLLRVVIYCSGILLVYPYVTRWFLKHYSDQVSQFVFVLAMVFLSSYLAQVVGLEGVLGAFLAGLVMNRYVPATSSLMNRLEFVGNAIFIPYFLIQVGMMINVRVISNADTLFVSLVMILVAIFVKWLAAFVTQKIYKMTSVDRDVIFGLTTAHTAVALAVVMVGYKVVLPDGTRILSESVLNGTVLMILVTCIIAPIVTANAGGKLKVQLLEKGVDVDDVHKRRSLRTLIPVSNPQTAKGLVSLAMMMKRNPTDNSICALYVKNDNSGSKETAGKQALDRVLEYAAGINVKVKTMVRYDLNAVTGIVNAIKERDITDIIIGLHQKSLIVDSFYGSRIEQLLAKTSKMVIISRCFIPLNTMTRIVVAVPQKAEYESGFELWVIRMANLARRIGCKIVFHASKQTIPYIKGVLHNHKYELRGEYCEMEDWGDFVRLSNGMVDDDDLFVMINARHRSISFNSDLGDIPNFLSKYFAHNNMLIIYPEQFGERPELVTFNDPLTIDLHGTTNHVWSRLRARLKWLRRTWKKRG